MEIVEGGKTIMNILLAFWGLGKTLVDDLDDLLTKIVGDMVIIEPICELD